MENFTISQVHFYLIKAKLHMMVNGCKTNLWVMEFFITKILIHLINHLITKISITLSNFGQSMKENFHKIVKMAKGFFIYQMVNISRVISLMILLMAREYIQRLVEKK